MPKILLTLARGLVAAASSLLWRNKLRFIQVLLFEHLLKLILKAVQVIVVVVDKVNSFIELPSLEDRRLLAGLEKRRFFIVVLTAEKVQYLVILRLYAAQIDGERRLILNLIRTTE